MRIRVAEAAKVIENTQRDLNVARMNELAIILDRIGIRTSDVLAVSHRWYLDLGPERVAGMVRQGGVLVDVKSAGPRPAPARRAVLEPVAGERRASPLPGARRPPPAVSSR